jgi:hypothetical protein
MPSNILSNANYINIDQLLQRKVAKFPRYVITSTL